MKLNYFERLNLQNNMNQFELKILTDKNFRDEVKEELEN